MILPSPDTASAASVDNVGICILNWNAGECLSACVRSLEAARSALRFHLVVVDNDSSDDSIQVLLSEFPNIAVIRNRLNVGYAAGNNIGARHLEALGCEYVIFINPDVTLPVASLVGLVRTLADDPQAGCAGGVPLSPLAERRIVARNRPSAFEKIICYGPLRRAPFLNRVCRRHWLFLEDLTDRSYVYAICGACIAFRVDAFRQIGGFDENTFLFEEEFIVSERLQAYGWRVVVSTGSPYVHIEGVSIPSMPYGRRLHFVRSESYLLRHYYGWSRISCGLLRLYRYVEFCLCSVRWWWLHPEESESGATR